MKRLIIIIFIIFVAIMAGVIGPGSDNVKNIINNVLIEVSEKSQDVGESLGEEISNVLTNDTTKPSVDSTSQYNGPYKVKRVVDGDTLIVNINGEECRVRMIGINTPESVSNDESENCEEGVIASNYTKDLLTGKYIYLEYDEDRYDDYDRMLAYVYTDNKVMVNKLLIKMGYARIMTIQPNTKYEKDFIQMQQVAIKDNVGFWAAGIW